MTEKDSRRGFVYLSAVMDWASRRFMSFRLSNTLSAEYSVNWTSTLEK
jgi:putative transposase